LGFSRKNKFQIVIKRNFRFWIRKGEPLYFEKFIKKFYKPY
jgi:hypothetical protein